MMDDVQKANSEQAQQEQQIQQVQQVISPDDLPAAGTPYTINEAIVDAIEQVTDEPFPDPFDDKHEIEYWLWTGSRLVPASPDAAERLRQREAQEKAGLLLAQQQRRASRRLPLVRWLMSWWHSSSS